MKGDNGAIFSGDRGYRYRLWRIWNPCLPRVLFVMLNPSVADETIDDPTLKKCIGFAKSWGFGGLYVGNLFPWVCTQPGALLGQQGLEGVGNESHLYEMLKMSDRVVCAWGNGRLLRRLGGLPEFDCLIHARLYCIRKNADGHPAHPLYLKYGTPPLEFRWPIQTTESKRN